MKTFIYERRCRRHRLDVARGLISFDGGPWHGQAVLGPNEIVLLFNSRADTTGAAREVFARVKGSETYRYEGGERWSVTLREAAQCKCCNRLLTLASHEKCRGVCWPPEPRALRAPGPLRVRGGERPCADDIERCGEPPLDCNLSLIHI